MNCSALEVPLLWNRRSVLGYCRVGGVKYGHTERVEKHILYLEQNNYLSSALIRVFCCVFSVTVEAFIVRFTG